ncbi:Gfo/Idh/MocA family protein [Jiangella endophytica]|uniref:Gfo/Idh/MocA family protein n=1 Tax=Jiangella endophytica TaxID=1623398 RepID=UPI000E34B67C|nr:Gfo/Idh/MocA family oxidoreductase [Jiangella endophytica]
MNATGRVGIGVVGAGSISDQYLQNLGSYPDVEVHFVADLDADRARAKADQYGVPSSGTPGQLLAHAGIEIVVNLTVPSAHFDVAVTALRAGKHVWSEKPLTLDPADAQRLLIEARSRGLRIAAAPDTFLGPGLQKAIELVREGAIGTPQTAVAMFQVPGPESWHPNPSFLYAPGGGPLFDVGPYYLTALIQLLGPVARVGATANTARHTRTIATGPHAGTEFPVLVPTHVAALLEFESGATAQALFSFQSPMRRVGLLEISGTSGTMVLPDPNGFDGDIVVIESDTETVVPTVARTGRGTGVVDLARAIRAGVRERASGSLAYHVLDIMVAIDAAAEQKTFVPVTSTVTPSQPLPEDWDPHAATLEV